ncbi:MAG: 4Fe-4S dicluster domain-containing protein, partial [Desulfovibrionaceae bacterium]
MEGKSFFVDMTKCTACRGCQIACKQWKKLPAEETRQLGTHQNPPDLSSKTIRLVRYTEVVHEGMLHWLFFPEQCRHCVDPPCYAVSGVE